MVYFFMGSSKVPCLALHRGLAELLDHLPQRPENGLPGNLGPFIFQVTGKLNSHPGQMAIFQKIKGPERALTKAFRKVKSHPERNVVSRARTSGY